MTTDQLCLLVEKGDPKGFPEMLSFLFKLHEARYVKGYGPEHFDSGLRWEVADRASKHPLKSASITSAFYVWEAKRSGAPRSQKVRDLLRALFYFYHPRTPEERQQQYDLLEAKIHELFYPQA
jgi:hypothetical protein